MTVTGRRQAATIGYPSKFLLSKRKSELIAFKMKGPKLDRPGPSWILSHVWSSLQGKITFLAACSIVSTQNQSWILPSKARITLSLSLQENYMALLLLLKAQPWKGAESKENPQDVMGSYEPQLSSV